VAFLLLIFVLLISLAGNPQKIKIDYPETPRAYDTRRDKNCEIAITEGGEIYLNGLPGNLAQAKALIEDLSDRAPDTGIHVLADRRTPFQNVHGVLELLQGAAYPAVSFAVREEGQK
jgi:biopolymer transport protein ExbD